MQTLKTASRHLQTLETTFFAAPALAKVLRPCQNCHALSHWVLFVNGDEWWYVWHFWNLSMCRSFVALRSTFVFLSFEKVMATKLVRV